MKSLIAHPVYNLLVVTSLVCCAPFNERLALDSASEYSSSVQKTFQQDINVKQSSLIGAPLGTPVVVSRSLSHPGATQVVSSGPIFIQPRRHRQGPVVIPPVGLQHHIPVVEPGIAIPGLEEKHHVYREESEDLSKTPILGAGGGLSTVQRANTEKIYRKSSVSKPVVTGGII